MSKIWLCLLLLFAPFSCLANGYSKIANQIVNDYANQISKQKGLILTARGGAMMCDVKRFILKFSFKETLTVEEARILYVDMMEDFLHRVNQNKKIRPYLHNYPIETNNFELTISYIDPKRKDVTEKDNVVLLCLSEKNKKLYFVGYNTETENYYKILEEPYAEALKIVNRQK